MSEGEFLGEFTNGVEDEEVEEEDVTAEPCPCLFCSTVQPSALATLDHCKAEHNVDLASIATKLGRHGRDLHILRYIVYFRSFAGSDCYSCIKLINYIRKEVSVCRSKFLL